MIKETSSGFNINERFQFWRQLAAAGLIEGTYSGDQVGAFPFHSVGGTNVPRARLSNGLWYASSRAPTSVSTVEFTYDYGNYLQLGAYEANLSPNTSLMKPEEAWNIDTKMDDGMPGRGKVLAADYNSCATASSDVDYAATYRLTLADVRCRLMFRQAF